MSTHAAGEGGNPLQRGVGSPIHTPTLGGGDATLSSLSHLRFLCTPHCLPPVILATSSHSNWNGAMGVSGDSSLCWMWTTRGSVPLWRSSLRWNQEGVGVSHEGKPLEKHNGSRQCALKASQCTLAINQAESCSDGSAADQWVKIYSKYEIDDMNVQSKRAQFVLSDTHQAVNYYSLATSQQTPCLLPSINSFRL